jgi:hypothetical protein
MSDELDDYEARQEKADAREDERNAEVELADAVELTTASAEDDDTAFDETRLAYSGVEAGDGDVDEKELEEAGALLDDPEREERPTET